MGTRAGDSPWPELDIGGLCKARGWSRPRLAHELRVLARREGTTLPGDESLVRMIRLWDNGSRVPSDAYARLLQRALRVTQVEDSCEDDAELVRRLDRVGTAVDSDLIQALDGHTESLRRLDRRIGAEQLLGQSEVHVRTVTDLVAFATLGKRRQALAAIGAEAAALAGWQALDLGRPKRSWSLHQQARALALEASDVGVLAHVTAQQAYALIDVGRPSEAAEQMAAARHAAGSGMPDVVNAWLAAAEAEARAACRERGSALRLLDEAEGKLSAGGDPVPFIFLDAGHLARWRGHCLARVGDERAVRELTAALEMIDPSFSRAAAALHADLAMAYLSAGERRQAHQHATEARRLSLATSSARQNRRVSPLLDAESQKM